MISARASGNPTAGRYGRSVVSASSASATANTRAESGICLAAQAVRVAACRPSARGGGARPGTASPRKSTPRRISEPMTGWRSTSAYSSAVSLPVLNRIESGTATLPTSCSRKPNSVCGSTSRPDGAADAHAVGGDTLGVLAGVGVARLDRVGERAHGRHVGAPQLSRAGALLLEDLAQVRRVALQLQLPRRRLAFDSLEAGSQRDEAGLFPCRRRQVLSPCSTVLTARTSHRRQPCGSDLLVRALSPSIARSPSDPLDPVRAIGHGAAPLAGSSPLSWRMAWVRQWPSSWPCSCSSSGSRWPPGGTRTRAGRNPPPHASRRSARSRRAWSACAASRSRPDRSRRR